MRRLLETLCCAFVLFAASVASAQQVNVSTPYQQLNNSFFENYNIGWGYNGRNPDGSGFFFNGPGPARPPFGGFDPNGEAAFGIGNGRGFFNFSASQGNSSSISTEIPNVTVPNGYGGSVSNTSLRPFVTGFIPVVGDCGTRHWVPGPFPILVTPTYPSYPDYHYFHPTYASPLGPTPEIVDQNIQRAQEKVAAEKLASLRAERDADSKALAEEKIRLRKLAKQRGANDDPPLRLGDQ